MARPRPSGANAARVGRCCCRLARCSALFEPLPNLIRCGDGPFILGVGPRFSGPARALHVGAQGQTGVHGVNSAGLKNLQPPETLGHMWS